MICSTTKCVMCYGALSQGLCRRSVIAPVVAAVVAENDSVRLLGV